MHAVAALNYVTSGHSSPDFWYHPPLKHILEYASIKTFGDNPYGWRMRNVLFGAGAVVMLFLLTGELFSDTRKAFVAALLICIEPLHILYSRSSFEEIPATAFIITALYFTARHLKGKTNSAIFAGVFFGLALAIKWYFIFTWITAALCVALVVTKDEGMHWDKALYYVCSYLVIPASVYLLVFYQWFGRGYGFRDFCLMQFDAYRTLQLVTVNDYLHKQLLGALEFKQMQWFVKPIIIIFQNGGQDLSGQFVVFMNNFPFWLLVLPSLVYLLYHGLRYADRHVLIACALFIVTYLQFLLVRRPLFIHSTMAIMPFAYILLAYFLVSIVEKLKLKGKTFNILMALIALWGVYLYPFVTGRMVPVWLYKPILALSHRV